uniref:Uncharacterized protein n=1 Tax=Anopheles christyi TaxID=43041 RepID=A0A182K8V8_9DIPT
MDFKLFQIVLPPAFLGPAKVLSQKQKVKGGQNPSPAQRHGTVAIPCGDSNCIESQAQLERANNLTKFIKTGIADKNDYPLYFEKVIYEADIDENVEINHNFLNVTAKTHGEGK